MKKNLTINIISIFLILLWVYSAVSNVSEIGRFQWQLGELPWLESYARGIAYTLPVIEIILALMILIPGTRLLGLWASLVIIAVFVIYLVAIAVSGRQFPFFCNGHALKMSLIQYILFNIFCSLLIYSAIWLKTYRII